MEIDKLKKYLKELSEILNNFNNDLIQLQTIKITVIFPSIYDYIEVAEYILDYDINTRFKGIPNGLRMYEKQVCVREWIIKNDVINVVVTADFYYLIYLTIKIIEKVIDHPGNIDLFNSNYILKYITNMRDIVKRVYSIY